MNRRELLRGAAWSVPVIAAAIAAPLAAASEPIANRIRFTNVTATVGKDKGTVYANTKVQVIDGPAEVHGLRVTITLAQSGVTFTHEFTEPVLTGWGGTEQLRVEQSGFTYGEPVQVFFTATALGAEMLTGYQEVKTPKWWQK